MMQRDLQAQWELAPDPAPCRYSAPPADYPLTMQLPGTTAQQCIGQYNPAREAGCFSEKYPYAGQIWLRLRISLTESELAMPHCFLILERTRMTRLWVNGRYLGGESSLCTPHVYDLSGSTAPETELVLCVKNTDYPVPGGHMTSPDTQTNWIGVTGSIRLEFHAAVYLSGLQAYPDAAGRSVTVRGLLHGAEHVTAKLHAAPYPETGGAEYAVPETAVLSADAAGRFSVRIPLPEQVPLWDEDFPAMTALCFELPDGERQRLRFGLRDFRACGDHFELNGVPVFLRGKHDGMVFPLTGAAPTDTAGWLERLRCVKQWGINHIRFHTCCPPEAAFDAADALGIFMEPELPFWGTVDAPGGEKYDKAQQEYLIREGLRICRAFANHPSFCMMSLGNELWGSPERLGEIIDILRSADSRPLYTQGSNNFQFMPVQLPQEDFWTGVRTGAGRLLRGSYAACDAPLGRIQTHAPSAAWDYEEYLVPEQDAPTASAADGETEIAVQYGTGVKTVKAAGQEVLHPTVPVVTHEIGQYCVYPDFREISGYTGVLAARSFEIFRERLEAAGMGGQAEEFFRCSGALAADCYKAEIEAAMRTPHLAGFQLLDLQDFPGQGSATVGMLNARMEDKGLIPQEEWRGFCGALVPLAVFDSFVLTAGETFTFRYAVRSSRPVHTAQPCRITLTCGGMRLTEITGVLPVSGAGLIPLGAGAVRMPEQYTGEAELIFELPEANVKNHWTLTVLPPVTPLPESAVRVTKSYAEARPALMRGESVLLLPETVRQSVPGFYCTDFWNYHMFHIISQSMGKEPPVGTMGLCMDTAHPVVRAMCGRGYSTPQWYEPVMHADCAVLDSLPDGFRPVVQMIDNPERSHRLGLILECGIGAGRLLVCTVRLHEKPDDPAMNRLHHALLDYMQSAEFDPAPLPEPDVLAGIF